MTWLNFVLQNVFLQNNKVRILKNSGLLNIIILKKIEHCQNIKKTLLNYLLWLFYSSVSSEFGTQNHCRSMNFKSSSKNVQAICLYTHPQFKSKEQSREFQKIINKQDKDIQFTIEHENEEKSLNFLDIKIKNNNVRYEFDFRRKPALSKY